MRYANRIRSLSVTLFALNVPPGAAIPMRFTPELFGLIDATSNEGRVFAACEKACIAIAAIAAIANSMHAM